MISTATAGWLIAAAVWGVLLPLGLLIWWRRTRRAKLLPFFIGALVFMVFSQGLEGALHYLVLLTDHPVSRALHANPYLYMLYGAFAAGVFEETGRYVAFRWLLSKQKYPERDTAVSYGIGHGGIEAVMLLGVTYGLYAAVVLTMRGGDHAAALAMLGGSEEALSQILAAAEQFTPGFCLLATLERVAALMLHIGLSLYVFLAVRDRTQWTCYPFAIALHALADMPAALYQRGLLPLPAVELWLLVFALYVLRAGRKCYLEEMDP